MNRDPLYKITKARSELIRIQPFFGTLALRLELREHTGVPVMGTDGRELIYNPAVVATMPQPHVIGVVAHEVLHCALQHIFRRGHRDHLIWNKAIDYATNAILLQEGYSLPQGRLYDPKYNGMSAEAIYEQLIAEQPSQGAGSDPDNWNFGASLDPAVPGADGKNKSTSEVDSMAHDWRIATQQAAQLAKAAGTLPGSLEELVTKLLRPQIPWKNKLWHFFNNRKPGRITWNKPNRRLVHTGIFLPARRFIPVGDIVLAIDTSGSISPKEFQHFATEMMEIHRTVQPQKMYVVDIDTQIQDVKEYGPYDKLKFQYKGRGGTSFDPLFEWIRKKQLHPDAVVYLTDGYASWPKPVTEYPVLWVITNHTIRPPWGQHLVLDIQ